MSAYSNRLERINALAGRPRDARFNYEAFAFGGAALGGDGHRTIAHDREDHPGGTDHGRELIFPEVLAVKLESAKAGDFPEMRRQLEARPGLWEMLWWLQWRSFQPGHLESVAGEAVKLAGDRLGFPELHAIKPALKGRFSESQITTLLEAAPWMRSMDGEHNGQSFGQAFPADELLNDSDFVNPTPRRRALSAANEAFFRRKAYEDPEAWISHIRERAMVELPGYLHSLCLSPAVDFSGRQFPWIADAIGFLIELCHAHAERVKGEIPETSALRTIWREADFARSAGGLVVIVGDTRLGKSYAAKGKEKAWPGCFRFIDTPEKTDLGRYWGAWLCAAGGEEWASSIPQRNMGKLAEYIYRVSRLTAFVDEAQYVMPIDGHFRKATAANRMEWTRRELLDKGVGMIFTVTPQSQKQWDEFVRVAEYPENQLVGRTLNRLLLPARVPLEDLRTIVNHILKGSEPDAIDFVFTMAKPNPLPLRVVHVLVGRARALYMAPDRQLPTYDDIEAAWEDVKEHLMAVNHSPQQLAEIRAVEDARRVDRQSPEAPGRSAAAPAQDACKPSEDTIQAPRISRGKRSAMAAPQPRGSIVPDLVEA